MVELNRRRFVSQAAVTCGTGAVALATTAGETCVGDALDQLHASCFKPLIGQQFQVRLPNGGREPVTLVEVADLNSGNRPFGIRQTPFRMLFRGMRQSGFEQGTYKIEHPHFGTTPVLMVPVGSNECDPFYEVIFS